jgi:hypothetical protein
MAVLDMVHRHHPKTEGFPLLLPFVRVNTDAQASDQLIQVLRNLEEVSEMLSSAMLIGNLEVASFALSAGSLIRPRLLAFLSFNPRVLRRYPLV